MPDPGERRYRIAHAISWQQWDDEIVVFDPPSAQTHLIGEPRASILRALLDHPEGLTVHEIADSFADDLDDGHDDDAADPGNEVFDAVELTSIEALVTDLAQLGLVQSDL